MQLSFFLSVNAACSNYSLGINLHDQDDNLLKGDLVICREGQWVAVESCGGELSLSAETVTCRQLGPSPAGMLLVYMVHSKIGL